ncbi:MAG: HD domain-containing protein [Alphaproteobacteria bacterium]|nr:HD domain-containing protein [Alphaproteobacteria bacterium]
MTGIEYIKTAVSELLRNNSNGHDDKHVFRVYDLAMKFCDDIPDANRDLAAAGALLHDCDDYKLFGEESERLLTNTRRILSGSGFDDNFCEKCINIVKTIGYSKRLKGIAAYGLEGAIVSDADMCDASGGIGMLRCIEYRAGSGEPFFDPDYMPSEMDATAYRQSKVDPCVTHFFNKILHLRDMCITEPGRKCAARKHQTIVDFLTAYFDEVNAPQVWKDLLAKYK